VKFWWIQPLARALVALGLPLLVPALITVLIWALPGNPAEIICPPSICTGGEELAARWNLDQGPWGFYTEWVSSALQFEFGDSWRVLTGKPVLELMQQTIPNTLLLIVLALIPITVGSVLGAFQKPSKRWDSVLVFLNVWPVVVLALLAAAIVELNFAGADDDGLGYWV
jgi:ABC-type dipeptide/oligopeptide/nickel transport system permease component